MLNLKLRKGILRAYLQEWPWMIRPAISGSVIKKYNSLRIKCIFGILLVTYSGANPTIRWGNLEANDVTRRIP